MADAEDEDDEYNSQHPTLVIDELGLPLTELASSSLDAATPKFRNAKIQAVHDALQAYPAARRILAEDWKGAFVAFVHSTIYIYCSIFVCAFCAMRMQCCTFHSTHPSLSLTHIIHSSDTTLRSSKMLCFLFRWLVTCRIQMLVAPRVASYRSLVHAVLVIDNGGGQ
jgi:hypothetical protein